MDSYCKFQGCFVWILNQFSFDDQVESTVNGTSAESETNHEVEDNVQNGYYSTVQDSHEEPEYENPSNSFQTKPISYADLYENKDQENKVSPMLSKFSEFFILKKKSCCGI